jgi:hypothetical protein
MRTAPPKTHPGPQSSELWPQLDKIRELRRKRRTWTSISKELERTCGIKVTEATVRNFFKRARRRVALQRNSKPQLRSTPVSVKKSAALFIEPEDPTALPDDDPFSTNVIPFDPWKPQRKSRAS